MNQNYYIIRNMLNYDELNEILSCIDYKYLIPATIDSDNHINNRLRNNSLMWLYLDNGWQYLHDIIKSKVQIANDLIWKLDIDGQPEDIQFTNYEVGEFYDFHRDNSEGSEGKISNRSLSVTVCLRNAVEGGGIEIEDEGIIPLNRGDGVVFPSYICHRAVAPTEGIRQSLVLWFAKKED